MSCSHADTCPLFPLLNANLARWRRSYCDTDNEWRSCARYERMLQGKPVPMAMLPNGRLPAMVAARAEPQARDRAPAPRVARAVSPVVARAPAPVPEHRSWWARLRFWRRRPPASPGTGREAAEGLREGDR